MYFLLEEALPLLPQLQHHTENVFQTIQIIFLSTLDSPLTSLTLTKFTSNVLLGCQEMSWALAVKTISFHFWRKMTV